jgi:hypothetical protein
MLRILKFALQAGVVVGLIGTAVPAVAGGQADAVQLAFHTNPQTATLPAGTIRLRVIPRVGGRTLKVPIKWRIMTYGRDKAGRRHLFTEATGATPKLVLPAGWYIVYAQLPDQELKHPVEVTAGRTFNYTLVRN